MVGFGRNNPDSRTSLMEAILTWYASPANWRPPEMPKQGGPYSSSTPGSAAAQDGGGRAARALTAKSVGELFSVACDVWQLSTLEVGRRAGLSDVQVASFVMRGDGGFESVEAPLMAAFLIMVSDRVSG